MTISELIASLEALKAKHGDCRVGIDDADTDWVLNVQTVEFDDYCGAVCVSGSYLDRIPQRR